MVFFFGGRSWRDLLKILARGTSLRLGKWCLRKFFLNTLYNLIITISPPHPTVYIINPLLNVTRLRHIRTTHSHLCSYSATDTRRVYDLMSSIMYSPVDSNEGGEEVAAGVSGNDKKELEVIA